MIIEGKKSLFFGLVCFGLLGFVLTFGMGYNLYLEWSTLALWEKIVGLCATFLFFPLIASLVPFVLSTFVLRYELTPEIVIITTVLRKNTYKVQNIEFIELQTITKKFKSIPYPNDIIIFNFTTSRHPEFSSGSPKRHKSEYTPTKIIIDAEDISSPLAQKKSKALVGRDLSALFEEIKKIYPYICSINKAYIRPSLSK